ncbi:hypothetical protein Z517_09442 [Fonsecaea pedrosoi CBS 271.37]|uniref:Unplaced genomic scaffold supercont1.6, whole genome shotgun sequence n=1 Tax=Fonsecaea pedrosoi CBS 271.37 TaxID=1442368 RepID=A0A0D2G8M6_9EURO|nr:uncharacterized protein Z517_09442 [Fonsecaea pedrosoi CBS 271.37]KIW76998.1 hypothetical protein Z517_09442 [Fonsecaea pedrosoi CBS 271.37]
MNSSVGITWKEPGSHTRETVVEIADFPPQEVLRVKDSLLKDPFIGETVQYLSGTCGVACHSSRVRDDNGADPFAVGVRQKATVRMEPIGVRCHVMRRELRTTDKDEAVEEAEADHTTTPPTPARIGPC